ncbi:polyprenyl synthetase family protein [Alkalibacterium kapii]|uniref:Geranylgeranyl pyrophosphate synthase n=1 Tax=Alkalibacterium kapii TaxID=426704 RepID=A0A511AQU3_9LACT|nr:polyprenyl synthetase family protein [Alkalibacterium kapii]GEK90538.1 geranylgeranyl pyrophosphate synthase [Alkalibacterium kapii]
MQIHPMWELYPEVKNELRETIALIDKEVFIRNKEIEAAILDMLHSGGKLLRPAYTLLFSTFGKDHSPERARSVAAAIELLHTATLIHDDIIDDASSRRKKQSIQSKYGKDVAVYAGDYLFTVVFRILSKQANTVEDISINTKGMERILMGELNQMHLRYKKDMSIRDYLTQISGKTAQLFALACYSGAIEGGNSKAFARNCYYIGSHIGMAFQIIDDVLDYTQSSENFGKPVLEDVRQGIYTAPLIFSLRKENREIKALLEMGSQITQKDAQKIQRFVHESGGMSEAKSMAEKYTRKALKRISKLPDTKEKQIIKEITEKLLMREM